MAANTNKMPWSVLAIQQEALSECAGHHLMLFKPRYVLCSRTKYTCRGQPAETESHVNVSTASSLAFDMRACLPLSEPSCPICVQAGTRHNSLNSGTIFFVNMLTANSSIQVWAITNTRLLSEVRASLGIRHLASLGNNVPLWLPKSRSC